MVGIKFAKFGGGGAAALSIGSSICKSLRGLFFCSFGKAVVDLRMRIGND